MTRILPRLMPLLLAAAAADAITLRGQVLSADANPVAEALVWLVQTGDTRSGQADGDGAFVFEHIAPGETSLVAYQDGLAVGGYSGLLVEDVEVEVVLGSPDTLKLRVIDREFGPVPGASVQSMLVADRFWVPAATLAEHGFPRLRTDDEGVLEVPWLPRRSFVQMIVGHYRYADSNVAYLPAGTEKTHQIVLTEGVSLRGRVTFQGNGVEDAAVSAFRTGVGEQRQYAHTETDPEGMYSMRVPEGEYLVSASHPRYGTPRPAAVVLLAAAQEEQVLDVELNMPRFIRGKVEFPDGEPCPGARLLFLDGAVVHAETFSDSRGIFELRLGLSEGLLRVLPPPGFMTETMEGIPVDMGGEVRAQLSTIRLAQLPEIRGVVLDEDRNPVAGALVSSVDLPWKLWVISGEGGAFSIQLQQMPEQGEAEFVAEHPRRFLRGRFLARLVTDRAHEIELEPFAPDQEQRAPAPDKNDLSELVNEPAPEIACTDWFNTSPVTLDALRGKVVVLTFWGGFDDSQRGIERIEAMRAHHDLLREDDDVFFLGIHDGISEAGEVEEYVHRYGITFPVGRDNTEFESFSAYRVSLIPQTVLIDKEGVLRYCQTEGRLLELIKVLRRR